MDTSYLSKFYKKSLSEKLDALRDAKAISPEDFEQLQAGMIKLPIEVASEMIENYILNYELPFGVAMNYIINEKELLIPMVTEEPSVIAAASNSGKIIAQSGGFQTEMKERLLIAQVALKNIPDISKAEEAVLAKESELI